MFGFVTRTAWGHRETQEDVGQQPGGPWGCRGLGVALGVSSATRAAQTVTKPHRETAPAVTGDVTGETSTQSNSRRNSAHQNWEGTGRRLFPLLRLNEICAVKLFPEQISVSCFLLALSPLHNLSLQCQTLITHIINQTLITCKINQTPITCIINQTLITCIINPGAMVVRSCCKASFRFSSI